VQGKVFLPWFHKASQVECFSNKDRLYRRPLGEDAYTYKLQIEGFADAILHGNPSTERASMTGSPPCAPWWPSPGPSRPAKNCGWPK